MCIFVTHCMLCPGRFILVESVPCTAILTIADPTAWAQFSSASPIHFNLHWYPWHPWPVGWWCFSLSVGFSISAFDFPFPGTKAPKFVKTWMDIFILCPNIRVKIVGQTGSGWQEAILACRARWACWFWVATFLKFWAWGQASEATLITLHYWM